MAQEASPHRREARFEFGKNWGRFLERLDEPRIALAETSLREALAVTDLREKTFLDVGSGSGLSSLAAYRLGARVHSFDSDPRSVACTAELRRRYANDDPSWVVERGDALDEDGLRALGQFDVVYSWGVLHHTGAMYRALGNVAPLVASEGRLLVAIYNDQGRTSRAWRVVKKAYNDLPEGLRFLVLIPSLAVVWGPPTLRDFAVGRPFATWRGYARRRGMAPWVDLVDWVGGYPFEVARPEEIFDFYKARGFTLAKLRTCGGDGGCNELLFARGSTGPSEP
jgi:SAM-dependent methyltransferase